MKKGIHNLLIFVSFAAYIILFCNCSNGTKNFPILIISDFGTDVDDAQAIAYLCSLPADKAPEITGIITTGDIPGVRAKSLEYFLSSMNKEIPIVIGSAFNLQAYPVSIKDSISMADEYLKGHILDSIPYELSLMDYLKSNGKKCNPMIKKISPIDFIDNELKKHKGKLKILILAQATDIAKYIALHQENAKLIDEIAIQGQVLTSPKGLKPDFASYNLRKDTLAAKIIVGLQKTVPMVFVGKYAAYKAQFTKEEIDTMGGYIKKATYTGMQNLYIRNPELFRKIFKSDNMDSITKGNNPYDLLTVMSLTDRHYFTPILYYNGTLEHKIIGNDSINICLKDVPKLKRRFLKVYASCSHQ